MLFLFFGACEAPPGATMTPKASPKASKSAPKPNKKTATNHTSPHENCVFCNNPVFFVLVCLGHDVSYHFSKTTVSTIDYCSKPTPKVPPKRPKMMPKNCPNNAISCHSQNAKFQRIANPDVSFQQIDGGMAGSFWACFLKFIDVVSRPVK